jgi:uncharacterized protein
MGELLQKLLINARAAFRTMVGLSRKGPTVAWAVFRTEDDLSQKLLTGAWLVSGTVLLGIVIWMFVGGESINAKLKRLQPSVSVTISSEGTEPGMQAKKAKSTTKGPEKRKIAAQKVGPAHRVTKPEMPKSKKAYLTRAEEPLISDELKKPTLQLHPHPDPQLIEKAAIGPLPIVSKDGRQPWRVYSRPFSKLNKKPYIAVVFIDLGVSADATEAVIQNTPGAVTLAFAPFARRLKDWIDISRATGHEVLVALPMEPDDYPINDAGPYTLLTSIPEDQNKQRLHWALSRSTGYVGVSTFMANKFTTKLGALRPVLSELKSRGLMLLDVRQNPLSSAIGIAKKLRMPIAARDLFLDDIATRSNIRARLAQAEEIAKKSGFAVAIARPYPVTVTEVARWAAKVRERGLTLAPISAIAQESLK